MDTSDGLGLHSFNNLRIQDNNGDAIELHSNGWHSEKHDLVQ
jgi:hypothetical protein